MLRSKIRAAVLRWSFFLKTPISPIMGRYYPKAGRRSLLRSLLFLLLPLGTQVFRTCVRQQLFQVGGRFGELGIAREILVFLRIGKLIVEFGPGRAAIPFGVAPSLCAEAIAHDGFTFEISD